MSTTPDENELPPVPGDTDAMAAEVDRPTVSKVLVDLARKRYRFIAATDGGLYALELNGPNIAYPIRGKFGVRQQLSTAYYETTDRVANGTALTDAITVLEGAAMNSPREQVWLRVGQHDDGYVLDLGTPDGRAVVVTADGWHVAARSPVVFRRNELTLELPEPVGGGDPRLLLDVLNVAESDAPALLGWLIAALVPDIPHPVLLLTGEQGTGKSTAADLLLQLVDPTQAPLLSPPSRPDDWMHAAQGSWIVAVDNLSGVPLWLSDSLCRAATGDGQRSRTLYTDDGYSVRQFRRCVILTGIALDNWRGDLAERLLTVELERITPTGRRADTDLRHRYNTLRPAVLGGLLDVMSRVLAVRDQVTVAELPRMADFARLLAAVDHVTGWGSLNAYTANTGNVAADVVSSDPVASAVAELVEQLGNWSGTATDLLALLNSRVPPDMRPSKGWPTDGSRLSSRLKGASQALLAVGVNYEKLRDGKARQVHLTRCDSSHSEPSLPSPASQAVDKQGSAGDGGGDSTLWPSVDRHPGSDIHTTAEQGQLLNDDGDDGDDGLLLGLLSGDLLTDRGDICSFCGEPDSQPSALGNCLHDWV